MRAMRRPVVPRKMLHPAFTLAMVAFLTLGPAVAGGQAPGGVVIRGRVVHAETGLPVADALVSLDYGSRARTTHTDENGRYGFANLPYGTYLVSASSAGMVTVRHGRRHTTRSDRVLDTWPGDVLEDIDFALTQGSTLEGRLVDERGEPVVGVNIRVVRPRYSDGLQRLVRTCDEGVRTDERGHFRIDGIPPGDYLVAACLEAFTYGRSTVVVSGVARPIYYPGTASPSGAEVVRIAAGQELSGMVFPMVAAGAATLAGTVLSPDGRPVQRAMVTLVGADWFTNAWTSSDGSFAFTGAAPGRYRVMVSVGSSEVALARVVLAGTDVSLTLTPSHGSTARGRIRFDTVITDPESLPRAGEIVLQSGDSATSTRLSSGSEYARKDGSFAVTDILGPYLLRMKEPSSDGWHLKQVLRDGLDVTDTPIEFSGSDVDGLEIVLTQQVTEVTGTVRAGNGRPAGDSVVVMFADDPDKWGINSRFVRAAWPRADGRFFIRGLPPGRYVLLATADLNEGDETNPAMLARARGRGTIVILDEGSSRAVDLTLSSVSR